MKECPTKQDDQSRHQTYHEWKRVVSTHTYATNLNRSDYLILINICCLKTIKQKGMSYILLRHWKVEEEVLKLSYWIVTWWRMAIIKWGIPPNKGIKRYWVIRKQNTTNILRVTKGHMLIYFYIFWRNIL